MDKKFGFSLIEVIMTVSIIGVLSATLVPSYTYMNKKKKEIDFEKRVMILENDFLDFLNTAQTYKTFEYPLIGTDSGENVGVLNIKQSTFNSFINALLYNTNEISYYNNVLSHEMTSTNMSYGECQVRIKTTLKTNEIFYFTFIVFDNSINYKDYAYLKSFVFQDKEGLSKEVVIL